MSEWRECKLDELGTLQRGRSRHRPRYAFHLYGGQYPFIQTGEIRAARKCIRKYEHTYTEAGLEQSKLWPKNTLCITIAANIAELAILSFDACFPDSVLGFIPDKDKTDLDFIYYTLTHFQKELKHIGEGSVQDNINLGTFQDVMFPIPTLPEQKAIAAVLSSLDDKIDLLHRQNLTLEAMAETLFRQWFVVEARKDWEEKPLGDFVKVIDNRGKTPPYQDIPTPYPIIEVNALTGKNRLVDYSVIRKYVTEETFNTWFRGHPKKFDSLISTVGSIGEISMFLVEKGSIAQNVVALSAINISPIYLFEFLKNAKDEIKELDIGSVQPSIKVPHLLSIKITVPPIEKIELFDNQVKSYLRKMLVNDNQIQILEALRDNLLPKLMSGEVRVKYTTNESMEKAL